MGDTADGSWGSRELGGFIDRRAAQEEFDAKRERRASELLDVLARSETGVVELEGGFAPMLSPERGEYKMSLRAAEVLVGRGQARWVGQPLDRSAAPVGARWLALPDAAPEEVDDDEPTRIYTRTPWRAQCLPGCPYAEPEHGRSACDECSAVEGGES